jgi:hypothetical protein
MTLQEIQKENEEEFDKEFENIMSMFFDRKEKKIKLKQYLHSSQLRLISAFKEMVEEKKKLPYEAQICQNRNGLDYCGTCEQAWEDCSCSARNTGYNQALKDLLSSLTQETK